MCSQLLEILSNIIMTLHGHVLPLNQHVLSFVFGCGCIVARIRPAVKYQVTRGNEIIKHASLLQLNVVLERVFK